MDITNNKLIIAGPGAGKTSHLIQIVYEKIKVLDNHRFVAVITYTNAATNEIKNRLSKYTAIPDNVFIGTIHSFLIRFILSPYGHLFNELPETVTYRDIEVRSNQKGKQKYIEENSIKKKLIRKGIVSYEQIESLSKRMLENRSELRELVSQRLQYLFIDEFQDANTTQFNIFELIRKQKTTNMYLVGDPEQSIMSFQNRGKGSKSLDNRPIINLQGKKRTYNTEYIISNHRSSKTIVDFINNFHCSIKQEKSNEVIKSENPVSFIQDIELNHIINKFNIVCSDNKQCRNKPSSRFFLGYENDLFKPFAKEFGLKSLYEKESNTIYKLSDFSMIICRILGKTKSQLMDELKVSRILLRELCLSLIKFIKMNPLVTREELLEKICAVFEQNAGSVKKEPKGTQFKIDKDIEELKKIVLSEQNDFREQNEMDYFMTIHKSKGLEADAVLIVAKSEKELKKWLETDEKIRMSDKIDMCRLGYVAFSRAKEYLCIACLENISDVTKRDLCTLGVGLV